MILWDLTLFPKHRLRIGDAWSHEFIRLGGDVATWAPFASRAMSWRDLENAEQQQLGASDEETSSPAPGAPEHRVSSAFPAARILVVDDEAPLRLLYRANFEAHGMIVIEAADGSTGLARARAEAPDLILLDVMMPGLDGWSVAERLREDSRTRGIPFVFATPRGDYRDQLRGLELGAVDYITLPCNPDEIASRVRTLVGKPPRELNALARQRLAEVKKLIEGAHPD